MIQLRDYQVEIRDKASEVLMNKGFVYLAMEVRTGKTLTSLAIAKKIKSKSVLFITKNTKIIFKTSAHL